MNTSGYAPARTLVIIAPDDVPTANTRSASTPQFAIAYRAAEAMPSESLPPLCVSVAFEETSQQVPEWGCEHETVSLCSKQKFNQAYRGGEDENVAVGLRKLRELRSLEVGLSGTTTVYPIMSAISLP